MKASTRTRAIAAIALVVAIFVASLVFGFVRLIQDGVRLAGEDKTAVFMTAQVEVEYFKLLQTLDEFMHNDGTASSDALLERFDILWSRMPVILVGEEGAAARAIDGAVGLARKLEATLSEIEPLITELRPGDTATYARITAALEPFARPIHQVVVDAHLKDRWSSATRSSGMNAMILGIALAFIGMVASSVALFVLLVCEIRRTGGLLRKATEAEARIARAEARLIDAMDTIPQGFALFDQEDRLVHCNRNYRTIVAGSRVVLEPGFAYSELCRAMVEGGQIVEARDDGEAWLNERLTRHRLGRNREDLRLADGRWINIVERRTRDGDIVTVSSDITDVKLREAVLTEARQQAEFANRAKSEFLANMSHELRTPLNAIIGFSEMIRDGAFGPVGNAKYIEYAGDIHESGAHLLELINDILDLSKVEAGEIALNEEIVDFARALHACVRLVGARARANGLALDVDIPDDLPHLLADERKVKQIFINLLSNAIKFTEPGGRVSLRVSVRADRDIEAVVADTGIGIAPRDIDQVMKPFFQVDSRLARKYEGTGLGLPLCKSLVALHGGSLKLESEVGVGTRVRIVFPATRARALLPCSRELAPRQVICGATCAPAIPAHCAPGGAK